MEKEIIKEYTNGELTVVWKPKLCIHSEVCVKTLPNVYHPAEKPWIQPEHAPTNELKAQIDKCPSGALSHYMKGEKNNAKSSSDANMTKIDVAKNGPLLVHGNIEIAHADGSTETKKRTTAFCRCGASSNKPFCDGTHNKIEFKG
ncbi:MAG: (4Fe-4S)-binding protein [Croceitalea sp.]|nr:(4Fe-4S)-binding protein [Croceitalea sp.]